MMARSHPSADPRLIEMTTPDVLLQLWSEHREAIEHPIREFEFARTGHRFGDAPYQLGVINLSRESSYRESIVHDLDAAMYRAKAMGKNNIKFAE